MMSKGINPQARVNLLTVNAFAFEGIYGLSGYVITHLSKARVKTLLNKFYLETITVKEADYKTASVFVQPEQFQAEFILEHLLIFEDYLDKNDVQYTSGRQPRISWLAKQNNVAKVKVIVRYITGYGSCHTVRVEGYKSMAEAKAAMDKAYAEYEEQASVWTKPFDGPHFEAEVYS